MEPRTQKMIAFDSNTPSHFPIEYWEDRFRVSVIDGKVQVICLGADMMEGGVDKNADFLLSDWETHVAIRFSK